MGETTLTTGLCLWGGLHCIMPGLHYGLLGSCGRIGSSASCLMDCSPSNCLNVYVKMRPSSSAQGFRDFPSVGFARGNSLIGWKWTKQKKKKWNAWIMQKKMKQKRHNQKTRTKDVSHRRWDAATRINSCGCNLSNCVVFTNCLALW